MKVKDPSGNESTAATVTANDTTDPTQPTGVAVVANGAGVSGTGEAGTTVTVTDANGQVLGTATVPANGKFYVTLDPALTNGEKVSVTLTDKAGNESPAATATAADTTAPADATRVKLSTDGTTVTGKGEPGAKAVVTVDGKSYEVPVAANGTFSAKT